MLRSWHCIEQCAHAVIVSLHTEAIFYVINPACLMVLNLKFISDL